MRVLTFIPALIMALCTVETALAQPCTNGQEKWVTACDRLSVIAEFGDSKRETCTYNPPPGWVIVEHKVQEHSSNNGGASVSTIAGGSSFASEVDVRAAFDRLDSAAGEYADSSGTSKFNGQLGTKRSSLIYDARRFSATHNTLQATVAASGHGWELDRKRGWQDITVTAHLYCVGPSDPIELASAVANEVGLVLPRRLYLVNNCTRPIRAAIRWKKITGEWVTGGWWEVKSSASAGLLANDGRVQSNNSIAYFYAEATDGSGLKWQGAQGDQKTRVYAFKDKELAFKQVTLSEDSDGDFYVRVGCAGKK